MTVQNFFNDIYGISCMFAVYYVLQLGRCAMLSLPVLVLILMLRKTVLRKSVFIKGAVWGFILPVLFVGRLRFFYESRIGVRLFLWWHNLCCKYICVTWIYLLGATILGVYIFRKRRRLQKMVHAMEKHQIGGREIFVTDTHITPFSTGLIHAKIVIPKIILQEYDENEIETIIAHERVHIYKGHLWIYFLWDVMRSFLWVNPLFTLASRYLKEDMEEICDRVTIGKIRGGAYEYGNLIVKSIRLIQDEYLGGNVWAAFAGEQKYKSLKQRITKVAAYKPYRKLFAIAISVCSIAFIMSLFTLVGLFSYPRYMENENIVLLNESGELFRLNDSDLLKNAFHADGEKIYIDKKMFDVVLRENGINEKMEGFYLGFGGFIKFPGIGSGVNAIYIDYSGSDTQLVVPYEDRQKIFFEYVYKNIL